MKGRPIRYSPAELDWIEANSARPRRELFAGFQARFDRPDVSLGNLKSLCARKGWLARATGRFEKGQASWNKGRKFPTAASNPNCRANQFKTGNLPHNTRYLGHERISKEGYAEVSVAETNPHTGFGRRYVLKHKWLWEKANGPVPAGHCLKTLDGNRLNTDPENWICIPRSVAIRLNRHSNSCATVDFDSAPPDLKKTILAAAMLADRAARAARRRRNSKGAAK